MSETLTTRWIPFWRSMDEHASNHLDHIPGKHIRLAIVLASAITLYTEMVMVRWHATCFHAFAIFKNVSLLSCFLGLAIGYGLSHRRRIALSSFLPLLALQTLLFGLLSLTPLGGRRINPVAEQLVMGTSSDDWSWLYAVEGNLFLAVVFVLNALMFIPLGHLAGRLMGRLRKVESYSLNLLGSLAGIGLFFLLSLAWTGPSVWIGFVPLLLAPFLLGHPRLATVGVGCMALIVITLGLVSGREEKVYYSPYQVISLKMPNPNQPTPTPSVRVNHCFYQNIYNCSPDALKSDEQNVPAARYYNLPYKFKKNPGHVLVVGAGTGNDVAAALRNDAESVTAVEIDPAIVRLGKHLHPERPYRDERTHVVVNDARSYLRQTDERFDTIIYGLLDSHTNLGAMTNVRLDSFVYTVDGFREAVGRLQDDGLLIVSYLVLDPKQGDRLYAMLQAAYPEQTPRAFVPEHGGTVFVAGPGLSRLPATINGVKEETSEFVGAAETVELATDDWPFFYMQQRTYPTTYLLMIGVLLVLSMVLVKRHLGLPRLLRARTGVFFFLGAGFMLIETKAITELGLVFGNTWMVTAVAVAGILLMVYAANQWVLHYGRVSMPWAFLLLAGTLLIGWGLAVFASGGVGVPLPKVVMPLVVTAPLLFAGLIFSSELLGTGDIGSVLSANLLGAVLGGFLEYNSMYWGLSSLYPLGFILYGLAFLSFLRSRRRSGPTVERQLAGTSA